MNKWKWIYRLSFVVIILVVATFQIGGCKKPDKDNSGLCGTIQEDIKRYQEAIEKYRGLITMCVPSQDPGCAGDMEHPACCDSQRPKWSFGVGLYTGFLTESQEAYDNYCDEDNDDEVPDENPIPPDDAPTDPDDDGRDPNR